MVSKIHLNVGGHVQGVGFRHYMIKFSSKNNLSGFTKNLSDGTVDVFAEGPKEDLNKLLDYIKSSPGMSYVYNVKVINECSGHRKYEDFEVKF